MATAVNPAHIAAWFSIPETTIQTLLDAPTAELVESLLQQIAEKAREYDEIKADKLRAEVELETEVHAGEQRARSLKASLEKALKDVEDLRKKLNDAGAHAHLLICRS
jgi:nucleoprotein TPR